MSGLDWLIARPVAHRGLHDAAAGVIENTPSAFTAAVAGNYAIECDLQVSADGEAMVHHDDVLGRLTDGNGRLDQMTSAELKRVVFKSTADRMISVGDLCDLVRGRVTLVIELKSGRSGDERLAARTAAVLSGYAGAAAVMSFDPTQIAPLRKIAPRLTRNLPATSLPLAVLKVAARQALPLVFSIKATRSNRSAGSPEAVNKRRRMRATAPVGLTA